jgi:hypothetical protein
MGDKEKGFCKPCCFGKLGDAYENTIKSCMNRVKKVMEKTEKEESIYIEEKEEEVQKEIQEDLLNEKELKDIKSPTYFPLKNNQFGHLPINFKIFFNDLNSGCDHTTTNIDTITKGKHCLLRMGVENNPTQSFISCISKAYNYYYGYDQKDEMDISKFKKLIIKLFNIDDFIRYQNGDLVTFFKVDNDEKVDTTPFETSILWSKIKRENVKDITYFKNVVKSFNNFINFLNDDNVIIDYAYLWDLICMPNPKLFIKGLNLVILNMTKRWTKVMT